MALEMAAVALALVTTSKVNRLGETAAEVVKSTSTVSPMIMLQEPPRVTSKPVPAWAAYVGDGSRHEAAPSSTCT